jgi:hypothetical protein
MEADPRAEAEMEGWEWLRRNYRSVAGKRKTVVLFGRKTFSLRPHHHRLQFSFSTAAA